MPFQILEWSFATINERGWLLLNEATLYLSIDTPFGTHPAVTIKHASSLCHSLHCVVVCGVGWRMSWVLVSSSSLLMKPDLFM